MSGSVPPTVTPVVAGSANIQKLKSDFSDAAAAKNPGLLGYASDSKQVLFSDGSSFKGVSSLSVEAKAATPVSLVDADSGKAFTNEGATSQIVMELPAAKTGLKFNFIAQDADGIQVKASAGDTIREAAAVSSAGGTATSGALGDCLELVCVNETEWFATSSVGTWTLA